MHTPLAILLVCYLLGILALSIYAGRRIQNEEDFIVAGRRLPLWLAWGTLLATWFGAATILGAAEAAREEGVRGTLLDPFASGFSLIVAGLFFARPLWNMKLLTMGDFYGRVFGTRTELVASCVLVPGYFGWIGAQFIALAGLQQTFFGIPSNWGILIGAGFILVYTLIGGMWSVTLTDTLQLAVLLVGVLLLGVAVFRQLGNGSMVAGVEHLVRETEPEFLTLFPAAGLAASMAWLATLGNGLFGNIPGQDLMQRVFSSKDATTAKRACILAGVVYVLFGLIPIGMGLASRLLMPDETEGAILGILAREFLTPTLTTIFVISLVSIIISTATSAVLAPASILSHNLLARIGPLGQRKLFVSRLAVVIMVAGGVLMAFSGETILGLLETSLVVVFVGLFVPLVVGIYGRPRGELSALLAIGVGSLAWLLRELMEGWFVPMPETLLDEGMQYADFIATQYQAADVGRVFSQLMYGVAVIPSALWGVTASFAGYCVGHYFDGKRGRSVFDET